MHMALSSHQLDAFLAVAKHKSFSRAAERLHLTQSALSQRIMNLEAELGSALLVREPAGLRLTELGQRLLRYGLAKTALEEEFLAGASAAGQGGVLRVGGFSTVTSSVLLPALAGVRRKFPSCQFELMSRELRDLPGLLASGAAYRDYETPEEIAVSILAEIIMLRNGGSGKPMKA